MSRSSSNVATHASSPSPSQILHQSSACHLQSSSAVREDHRPTMIRPKPQRSSLMLQQTAMASNNNLASVSAELLSIRPPTMIRSTSRSQSAMAMVDAHAAYAGSVNDDVSSMSKSCGASHEILDIFLNKEVSSAERDITEIASDDARVKDLIFTGSPPCRARNPMAQDAEFHHLQLLNPMYTGTAAPSPVRVEGFECNQGLSYTRSTDAMDTVQNSVRSRSYLSSLMA